jgi:hypothetical protein
MSATYSIYDCVCTTLNTSTLHDKIDWVYSVHDESASTPIADLADYLAQCDRYAEALLGASQDVSILHDPDTAPWQYDLAKKATDVKRLSTAKSVTDHIPEAALTASRILAARARDIPHSGPDW